jgi:hypothetical protein
MTCPWFALAIVAVLLELASPRSLFAGVVMAETSTASGPNGETYSQEKTVYVQGNKQKVERKGVVTITDLDKSVIYIIDESDRVYTEMPLTALGPAQLGDVQSEAIKLNKTGQTRMIANHPCNEYRVIEGNKLEQVSISACVSTTAPGAKEISEFDRKMVALVSGRKAERAADNDRPTLMLEKQSVLSFRVPDTSRTNAYHMASLLAETRISKIQLKPLSRQTFEPPKGYGKLLNRRLRTPPADLPDAPDQTVVVALNLPSDSQVSRL